MMKRKLLLAICLTSLCLISAPASADLVLTYHMDNAQLNYTAATKQLLVSETVGSQLQVRKENDVSLTILDNTQITGGADFDLALDLTLTDLPGLNNWSGTGTLKITDMTTTTNAVEAAVQIYNITAGGGLLLVQGYLCDLLPNTSILVNRGDPWVFVGEGEIAGEPTQGTANQVAMYNPGSYDGGEVLTIKFGIGSHTADTLFAADRSLSAGEVKGQVVPTPAAILLGILGLGVAGWRLRRFA